MSNYTQEKAPIPSGKTKSTSLARELFTGNFWMSCLAIMRYIPGAFRVRQVVGMAFFTDAKRDDFRNRVLRIKSESPRQRGTMNVSQMLHHLNLACGSALGFYTLPDESYLVSRTLFRWILIDWFPEQPMGLRVPKGFKIPHTSEFDFDFEKQQMLTIVDAASRRKIGRLGTPPDVRKNDGVQMGKALSNPHRLSPETIRSLVPKR